MKILIICLCFFNFSVFAGEKTLTYNSYASAKSAVEYFRFDLKSTAAGLLTARFPGFARKIELSWDKKKENITNLSISLPIANFDTGKSGRTQEMKEHCLEYKKYPYINVTLDQGIKLEAGSYKTMAMGSIRGKSFELPLEIILTEEQGDWSVAGAIATTLTQLNIQSPTKWGGFLSFDDNVKISFKFLINKDSV